MVKGDRNTNTRFPLCSSVSLCVQVPYFLVVKGDIPTNGECKTLLYGYGGFEVSLTPGYSGEVCCTTRGHWRGRERGRAGGLWE